MTRATKCILICFLSYSYLLICLFIYQSVNQSINKKSIHLIAISKRNIVTRMIWSSVLLVAKTKPNHLFVYLFICKLQYWVIKLESKLIFLYIRTLTCVVIAYSSGIELWELWPSRSETKQCVIVIRPV